MSSRGVFAWRRTDTFGWLAIGLERLALAAFTITILLLGYWRSIPLDWFSNRWTIGSQYQLVTLFNPQFQMVMLFPDDFAAAATIALWGLGRIVAGVTRRDLVPQRFGPRYVLLPLLGLAALSALSATQAILPIFSLEIALHLLLVAALVMAVINLRPPKWAVVAPLALLLAMEGVLSVAQARAQSTLLGHFLFGWSQDATAAPQSHTSIVQLPDGTRWLRAYGSFPHPNILGGFLCLAIPVVAGAYLRLPRRKIRSWLLLASLALGMLALLLSFSRAAWVGLLIGALWAGFLLWQKRRVARREVETTPDAEEGTRAGRPGGEATSRDRVPSGGCIRRGRDKAALAALLCSRPALLCILGVGLLVGLVAILGPVVQSRLLLNQVPLEQRSLNERVVLLEAGALFFTQHPWLGVGAGNMPLVELSYPPTSSIGEPTHNIPVTIAVETGLFGLLFWLIPPLGALWVAWRRRFALSAAGLAASVALMALLTVAQLDHYLWTQPTGSIIWWLAVVLAILWGG